MREIADETVNAELVPMLVMRCITHCQKHWPTVMELAHWGIYLWETDCNLWCNWQRVP